MAETEALLSVRGLRTVFPTRRGPLAAADGVDFDIAAGEALGVVGESGSGKSVTFLSVLGLVRPPGRVESGEILFEGRDLRRLPALPRLEHPDRPLHPIPGQVPDLATVDAGCRFRNRCALAIAACAAPVELAPAGAARLSRCIRAAEVSP